LLGSHQRLARRHGQVLHGVVHKRRVDEAPKGKVFVQSGPCDTSSASDQLPTLELLPGCLAKQLVFLDTRAEYLAIVRDEQQQVERAVDIDVADAQSVLVDQPIDRIRRPLVRWPIDRSALPKLRVAHFNAVSIVPGSCVTPALFTQR